MWLVTILLVGFASQGLAQRQQNNAASAPAPEYPRYPEITACPEEYGLQLYPSPYGCDQFYKCANGSLTNEICENGLLFDGKGGAVYNHCNYHWAVNCEGREYELISIARGICEYSFGIYSAGPCETFYTKCEYGDPTNFPCTKGLVYDERIHGCNWPDLLETCNPDEVIGFSCPEYIDPKDLAYKFQPFPRFSAGDCGSYITCVNGSPRLIGCGDYTVFNDETLGCEDPEFVPRCANYYK